MIGKVIRGQSIGISVRAGAVACIVGLAAASLSAWVSAGQTGSGVGIDYQVVAVPLATRSSA